VPPRRWLHHDHAYGPWRRILQTFLVPAWVVLRRESCTVSAKLPRVGIDDPFEIRQQAVERESRIYDAARGPGMVQKLSQAQPLHPIPEVSVQAVDQVVVVFAKC